MKNLHLCGLLAIVLALTGVAEAGQAARPVLSRGDAGSVWSQEQDPAAASRNCTYLLGAPGTYDGGFEGEDGWPDWQGWTHEDPSFSEDSFWQVDNFMALAGAYSMWCGTYYGDDPGYGNRWQQNLQFTAEVSNPSQNHQVLLDALLRVDVEQDYDWVRLQSFRGGEWVTESSFTGEFTSTLTEPVLFQPGDYAGPGGNEIRLRFRVESDEIWSDEDGQLDTNGACQLDEVSVTIAGELVSYENFESGSSADWIPVLEPGVGDFAQILLNLTDFDPCRSNHSPQVAFIDDGIVVPGTGGTVCTTWCYGPEGYIVNNTGGLLGPDHHLDNRVISPVLQWPDGYDGGHLEFWVYRHEELGAFDIWPGMFYTWLVRSTADPANDPIADKPWRPSGTIYYGGPDYKYHDEDFTHLLEPGRQEVQVALAAVELGWLYGWVGTDGTPAPYFDNVAVRACEIFGPALSTRSVHLANDVFPASGDIDPVNLVGHVARFDMAANISPAQHLRNDPGDSICIWAAPMRAGSYLTQDPTMHFRIRANPLYDPYRILPDGAYYDYPFIVGSVAGSEAVIPNTEPPQVIANRWCFDLPETPDYDNESPEGTFLFPGDVLHYYFEARDMANGTPGYSLLPADTSGFSNFTDVLAYPGEYTVRVLPSIRSDEPYAQPSVLLWDDAPGRGAANNWHYSLRNLGFALGHDFDLYETQAPSSGVGNGLGGRATPAQIDRYQTIFYSSGDVTTFVLGNGDYSVDPSADIQLLDAWLGAGDRQLLMTGDKIVSGLTDAGPPGADFLDSYMAVSLVNDRLYEEINGQTAPIVWRAPDNPVFGYAWRWIAHGACPGFRSFDAVVESPGIMRVAEFAYPNGLPGDYECGAGFASTPDPGNKLVLLPYDLGAIYAPQGFSPPVGFDGLTARSVVLMDVIFWFQGGGSLPPTGVTPERLFAVTNYPNPFNPRTTFDLTLPRDGEVTLRIYDLRGALVRTLVSGALAAGVHEFVWDGTAEGGGSVASGVYFAETHAGGEIRINKLALIK